jgi:hypothetical protein
MIPNTGSFLTQDFEIAEQPSKAYQLHLEQKYIRGYVDGQDAVLQTVYKILNTERYQYPIYSHNFGIELVDLFGKPVPLVCAELKQRITEALIQDSRIQSVDAFDFQTSKGIIHVVFTVHSIYGDISAEKELSV